MDRLNQLKGETGGSRDLTLDTSSPPSESFMTANESSTKFFSLSEVDSTYDVSPSKDSAISTTADSEQTLTDSELITNLSPIPKKVDNFQIGKQIEAANILSGGVNIFDDNDNSYDGDELVIDDNGPLEESAKNEDVLPFEKCVESVGNAVNVTEAIQSTDTEVVLQIDGKNVDAIAIGNGLYLYRKGVEELAAVQMIDDNQQQPSFKFLKVRENAEGNLEVYEEIEVEVPKKVPTKEGKSGEKKTNVPVKDRSAVVNDTANDKIVDNIAPKNDNSICNLTSKLNIDIQSESKAEVNLNGKKVKLNESRKSPLISTFTPMTYHSTPNKEGIPLTKTMVDQQLIPNRHSDNIKKTIEVHTDSCKKESPIKSKEIDGNKPSELSIPGTEKTENETTHPELLISSKLTEQRKEDCNSENINHAVTVKKGEKVDGNINIDNIQLNSEKCHDDLTTVLQDNEEIKISKKMVSKDILETKVNSNQNETHINEPNIQIKSSNVDFKLIDEEKTKIRNELNLSVTEQPIQQATSAENEKITKPLDAAKILLEVDENINIQSKSNIGNIDTCKTEELLGKNDAKALIGNTDTLKEKLQLIENIVKNSAQIEPKTVPNIDESNKVIKEFSSKDESGLNIDKLSNSEIPTAEKTINTQTNESQNPKNPSKLCPRLVEQEISVETTDECETQKTDLLSENINKVSTNCGIDNNVEQCKSQIIETVKTIKTVTISCGMGKNTEQHVAENTNKNEDRKNTETNESKHFTPNKTKVVSSSTGQINLPEDMQDTNKIVSKKVNAIEANDIPKVSSDIGLTKLLEDMQDTSNISSKKVNAIETIDITKEKDTIEIDKINVKKFNSDNILHATSNKEVATEIIPNRKEIFNSQSKIEVPTTTAKTEISKVKISETKSSNSSSAVPFGKWTEANRQEFLNKIKETKIPCSSSNTKQLKQPNDLNRRDILKKIDTQRQAHQIVARNQDFGAANKTSIKGESTAIFVNKCIASQKSNQDNKKIFPISETATCKNKHVIAKLEGEKMTKDKNESNMPNIKKILVNRKEINNQELIDKTIEGIINRAVSTKPHEEWKQTIKMDAAETLKNHNSIVSLDDMERKMNELHGIPFVERPAHELPQVHVDTKIDKPNIIKSSNIPHLLPFKNKSQKKDSTNNITENISDEEIIEHVPITGDMTMSDSKICAHSSREKVPTEKNRTNDDESKRDTIITEKDFDKFARRNSITYENCLTVNFDRRESHNVINTLVEKEIPSKKLTRNEIMLAESKAKSTNKHLLMRHNMNSNKLPTLVKSTNEDDTFNKNYQSHSKVQLAYQSALTAKRQLECPVTIIEDKPVKVVFLDSGSDFTASNLNVQGQELSPPKKNILDSDSQSVSVALDSDVIDSPYEIKLQDEIKSKSKHQRKQVLTPVDIPELELIEPSDLGIINESPKKKRKLEETKEKSSKTVAPKKSYLLNRAIAEEKIIQENTEIRLKESENETKPFVTHSDTISAIDNLVKAAELIETQSENKGIAMNIPISEPSINTPAKRGRGRPRKYPLSETSPHINNTPSTQKKPRFIESNISKQIIESDDSDSNEEFIKENWTMGKINENIVCPICNKLFRSENVVFKHVKHCTGPSPNRSDSDRRSLRQFSQSEGKSCDSDSSDTSLENEDVQEVKAKVKVTKPMFSKKDEIIVIEDTPQKEKTEETKPRENTKIIAKHKLLPKTDNLVCEFCGKTFRQLSYLVNHKQQHKRDDEKKIEKNDFTVSKSVFSCEVCKKEFRKLHHLVQHRIIHNSNPIPSKLPRKNSNDKLELNSVRDEKRIQRNEDQSAGFRCEPCDKSFRKLHHLVEHRETHDGINKKGSSNIAQTSGEVVKSSSQYVCELCKKTFKKLQHLTEHKEQHSDSCSEKSDDKSVKSSLSTKDIIHECSLCYMVFPNEHSLNKHTIICLRKKKQSAAKQAKLLEQREKNGENILDDEDKLSEDDIQSQSDKEFESETINEDDSQKKSTVNKTPETTLQRIEKSGEEMINASKIDSESTEMKNTQNMPDNNEFEISHLKRNIKDEERIEKSDDGVGKKHGKIRKIEVITIPDTPSPKKKIANVKRLPIGVKKQKTNNFALPVVKKEKTPVDTSDDDEIRYMLNPNFKENTAEEKVFMKVRANKRNSLQCERPNSKDLIKRRISLQNPPKVQRSKVKSTESKSIKTKSDKSLDIPIKVEPSEHTDSDDSDVKYSFPETVTQSVDKEKAKTVKRQSIVTKRKSMTGISRRKSLVKHKLPIPTQKVKRRTTEVEHRCDCGQLFSSAALLARHTSLAHTPPRVRRQRDPPPDKPPQTCSGSSHAPTIEKRKSTADHPKLIAQQKKSVASSKKLTVKTTRKSSAGGSESKTSSGKTIQSESNVKTLRSAAHKGVPVQDKMRKFMEKSK